MKVDEGKGFPCRGVLVAADPFKREAPPPQRPVESERKAEIP